MVEYRSPKPLVRVRILVPLLEHLRELRCFFYFIENSVGTPYYIKRHCVPESAVRGEGYIAVLSAHAPKCASSAHFVLERTSKKYQKIEKKC